MKSLLRYVILFSVIFSGGYKQLSAHTAAAHSFGNFGISTGLNHGSVQHSSELLAKHLSFTNRKQNYSVDSLLFEEEEDDDEVTSFKRYLVNCKEFSSVLYFLFAENTSANDQIIPVSSGSSPHADADQFLLYGVFRI